LERPDGLEAAMTKAIAKGKYNDTRTLACGAMLRWATSPGLKRDG